MKRKIQRKVERKIKRIAMKPKRKKRTSGEIYTSTASSRDTERQSSFSTRNPGVYTPNTYVRTETPRGARERESRVVTILKESSILELL